VRNLGREQIADADAQRSGDANEMKGGTVPHAAFDTAHVAAANLGEVGQGFLGDLLLFPEFADANTETAEGRINGFLADGPRHGTNTAWFASL
jgi:hypothetical protein